MIVVMGLVETEAYLAGVPARLAVTGRQAVEVTARKVKDSARQRISGHKYLPQYPRSITYEVKTTAAGVEAEIGPDKGAAQGALGNIIEYGSANNAPLPHLGPALEENADDLARGVEIAVAHALGL
ncbi:hypothetical protein AB0K09_00465 [Streptomyces sp. NPDC049577]|uniref:hypothetical protein n=1 Tax=Streptomyces sp. NPDC049577 TaxID=3155153 RepID=UPI00341D19D4